MLRSLLLLAAALSAAGPAAATDRRYALTDFDRIVVEGPYIVRVAVGRATSASASGSQQALDRLTLDQSGQTLRIRRNRSYWGGNPGAQEGPLTIELTTPALRSARLIGPGSVEVQRLEGLRADLSLEGSGRLTAAAVAADNLTIGVAGSGRLEVSGNAKTLAANLQGSGDLDAAHLRVENANITSVTSGRVALHVERTAIVTALGMGAITITGDPACTLLGANAALVRCGRTLGTLEQRE